MDEVTETLERATQGSSRLFRWVGGPMAMLMAVAILPLALDNPGAGTGERVGIGAFTLFALLTGLGLSFPRRMRWAARIAALGWGLGIWAIPWLSVRALLGGNAVGSVTGFFAFLGCVVLALGTGLGLISFALTGHFDPRRFFEPWRATGQAPPIDALVARGERRFRSRQPPVT